MDAVVFGIDVSSKNSTISICYGENELNSYQIENNANGFNQLWQDLSEFKNHEIVFESTGVYSRRLQSFLDKKDEEYIRLNPLQAKKDLDGLRSNKTDKNDARSLAMTQQRFNRKPSYKEAPVYIKLRDWGRYYAQVNHDLVSHKNRLHRCLQLTFPEIEDLLSNTDGELYWNIVQNFPTPQMVLESDLNDLPRKIKNYTSKKLGDVRAAKIADKLVMLAKKAYATTESDVVAYQVRKIAQTTMELNQEKKLTINRMLELAKDLPELRNLTSIPGIGERTAVLTIAEIGDFHRFSKPNKINAYIGIDLCHYESGNYEAPDHISKRGSKTARKVLFQAVKCMVSVSRYNPNHIADYYEKKKATFPFKKVAINSIHRLIRTMYHLVIYDQLYDYSKASHQA